jgi:flagellar biosynthesis/type III secretory pathway M-ring protein FliF/YscJ
MEQMAQQAQQLAQENPEVAAEVVKNIQWVQN